MNDIFKDFDFTNKNLIESFNLTSEDIHEITSNLSREVVKFMVTHLKDGLPESIAFQTKVFLDLIEKTDDVQKRNKYRRFFVLMATTGLHDYIKKFAESLVESEDFTKSIFGKK